MQQHAIDFLSSSFDALLYLPAVARLKEALRQGHFVAILSSSPDFLVGLIAQKFHVHDWRGSNYLVDDNNSFSQLGALMQGQEKAIHVKRWAVEFGVASENITAYSDSILDLPFLQSAGQKVAVMPDRQLRRLCQKYHWHIL